MEICHFRNNETYDINFSVFSVETKTNHRVKKKNSNAPERKSLKNILCNFERTCVVAMDCINESC